MTMSAQTCSRTIRNVSMYDTRRERSRVILDSVSALSTPNAANKRQVALKQRGIDKLLEEAREDNKENDAIHLGRK